jgi:HAD superfamily phosphoserine phosphatase-like hydrolase
MSNYIFLFDLDSTISKKEILPTISKEIGKECEMRDLTEATMRGEIPFKSSFLKRVELLSCVDVSKVNALVSEIPLNDGIANFIRENRERCYVLTGNLDVWISGLMNKLGLKHHVYCSKANVVDDRINKVISVVDKELMAKQFVQPMVVMGDGDNDSGMAKYADIAIGFGGVREIAVSLLRNIDYAFYDDYRCAQFLKTLL